MLATSNSGLGASRFGSFTSRRRGVELVCNTLMLTLLLGFGCSLVCETAFGAERDSQRSSQSPWERAEKNFKESETHFKNNPTNVTAAWQFARACFDLAELAAKDAERAELAQRGIAVCRQLIERDPKKAAAYYYLALNLGQL